MTDAGFYRTAQRRAQQPRSLLVQQGTDFYTNAAFKDFTLMHEVAALGAALEPLQPQCWVDVGCGTGGHAAIFAGRFGKYIGLDPSDIPESIRHASPLPDNVIRVQHDSERPLPVVDESTDLVSFIGSYDHIPNGPDVLRDSWRILKRGGHLLIQLTNYGFWLKRLVNKVTGRRNFTHGHEHFCVHDPETLAREVYSALPGAVLVRRIANYRHVPNLPKHAAPLYRSQASLEMLDGSLEFLFTRLLGKDDAGAEMILVFRK